LDETPSIKMSTPDECIRENSLPNRVNPNGTSTQVHQQRPTQITLSNWENPNGTGAGRSGMPIDEYIGETEVETAIIKTERHFSNLVLIGMPGSGKTSTGQLLAEKLRREFVDTDQAVHEQTGRSVPEIIRRDGEAFFRGLERDIIAEVTKTVGQVIATGGGSVLLKENRDALLQNGIIIYLNRPVRELPADGRPLSVDLDALYAKRRPVYESLCHYKIETAQDVPGNVEEIIRVLRLEN
jgi:shikimate dehydrogenase